MRQSFLELIDEHAIKCSELLHSLGGAKVLAEESIDRSEFDDAGEESEEDCDETEVPGNRMIMMSTSRDFPF